MNAKLIVEGREFDIEILDTELQELVSKSNKKTGYERLEYNENYFTEGCGYVQSYCDCCETRDTALFQSGNYYSDKAVAANNTRADNLMRQLRRFAVEHRKSSFDWRDSEQEKWSIFYDAEAKKLQAWDTYTSREFNSVYFDSMETVDMAINTFGNELIWYFTEYKDSL